VFWFSLFVGASDAIREGQIDMSVREIVSGLRKRLVRSRVESGDWAGYKALMQEILDGKDIDPAEAEAILESVSKSFDDLATDAELYQKRLEWSKMLDAARQAQPGYEAVLRKIDALEKTKQDFLAKYGQDMAHLQDQRTQAYTVVNMLSTAEAGLRQNVQDPLVLMVREETKREILALADRERELQERITGHDRTSYRFLIPDAQGDVDKFEREYKSTRLEAVKKKLDDAKGRLSGLERNKATAESALADVRKSMADVRKRQDEVEKRAMIP
jgi:hypothetical protein